MFHKKRSFARPALLFQLFLKRFLPRIFFFFEDKVIECMWRTRHHDNFWTPLIFKHIYRPMKRRFPTMNWDSI